MKVAELALAAFVLLGACLVWPLLAVANRPVLLLGLPLLAVYLFALWGAMVGAAAAVARLARRSEDGAA